MKLIIQKDVYLIKLNRIGGYVKLVDDNYVIQPDEELVNRSDYIEESCRVQAINYREKRDVYKYLAQDFTGQTSDVKDAICICCATTPQVIIPYYISQGMSYNDALIKYKDSRAIDIRNACDNYKITINSPEVALIMVKYLPQNELQRFVDETFKLSYLYGNYGIWGKKYNDSVNGIMDFVEDYDIYQGTGLSTYTLNPGTTLQDFINDLKNILIM